MGLKVDWQSVSFDDIITEVQQGKLDMGVSGFSITADRLSSVSFTIPHSTTSAQLIMLDSEISKLHITNGTITSLTDVKNLGLTVGTQDGTTEQQELQSAGVSMNSWDSFATAIQGHGQLKPKCTSSIRRNTSHKRMDCPIRAQGSNRHSLLAPILPCAFEVAKKAQTFLDK